MDRHQRRPLLVRRQRISGSALALAAALALLGPVGAQWAARPHYEMKPCIPINENARRIPGNGSITDPDCHYLPGWKSYGTDGTDGAYGSPFRDSVDLEWDPAWVRQLESDNALLFKAVSNGKLRVGVDTTAQGGMDLTLPLSGSRMVQPWDALQMRAQYLQIVDPEDPNYAETTETNSFSPSAELSSVTTTPLLFRDVLRSKGFPMCPNYWDAHGGEEKGGGPMNRDSMAKQLGEEQDALFYKFPHKKVASPLVGDPELSFCRKWQEKYDATCCVTYLDEDIREEFEEVAGGGYLGAHVFLQQYLCLPCHPMVSCMINEETDTLEIPYEFAKRLADELDDFDRTGLKVKIGEQEPDNGPLRQDELWIPSDFFTQQRGTGGGPAPPFPPPNGCPQENAAGAAWTAADVGEIAPFGDYSGAAKCEVTEGPEVIGENDTVYAAQYPADEKGECKCTGPGHECACIREFLLHTRPPGINGYDGLDLNIEIVAGDQCNVLFDLMAGAIEHPKATSASAGGRAAPVWMVGWGLVALCWLHW